MRSLSTSALAVALAATMAPAAQAAPDPALPVPAGAAVTVLGTGFGHGRGMSQWGAYGAADAGLAWPKILDFYYPGATQAKQHDEQMRVWVSRDSDGITEVPPQPRLRAVVGRTTYTLPAGPGYTAWRVVRSSTVVALQYRDARGTWRGYRIPRATAVVFLAGDTVAVTMPGGRREEYPGRVVAALRNGTVTTTVYTTTERYLRGVVPNEMPASWHAEALAAQSVAARTYASSYRARQRAKGSWWDVCDTIVCQVYRGTATSAADGTGRVVLDHPRATAAVVATAGTVLKTPGGNFVHAEFSASNGGQTVDGGAFSQVAKADPYDGRLKDQSWAKTVPATTLASSFGLGTLTSVQVLSRDGLGPMGGRALTLRLAGTTRTVDISGARLRQVLGLRSERIAFRVEATRPTSGATAAAATSSVSVQWVGTSVPDTLTLRDGRLYAAAGVTATRTDVAKPVAGTPSGLRRLVGVGDIDGDSRLDVLAVDTRNRLVIMRGDGRGGVSTARTLGGGWGAFVDVALRDVNGDRRTDLIATAGDGSRRLYVGASTGVVLGRGAYTGL